MSNSPAIKATTITLLLIMISANAIFSSHSNLSKTGMFRKLNYFSGSPFGAIPQLTEFTVIETEGKAQIKWIILNEIQTRDYVIEKSKDGKKFSEFVDIPCKVNGSRYHEYFEVDYQPSSFYRLKRKTVGNEVNYSCVVCVKRPQTNVWHSDEKQSQTKESVLSKQAGKKVLLFMKDKSGNEYSAKVFITIENGVLKGKDEENTVPPGEYIILASTIDAINAQRITILKS